MYYKTIDSPEEILIEYYQDIFDLDEELINKITILDISNPTNSKLNSISTLDYLPDFSNWTRLISLKANWHKISVFPDLPLNIELLELETNRIDKLPDDLAKYSFLENINLKDNHLGDKIDVILPESLRTLELGFNKIHKFESELPEEFGYLGLSYNFISYLPTYIDDHPCQKILDHNEGKYSGSGFTNNKNNGIFGLIASPYDYYNNNGYYPSSIARYNYYKSITTQPVNTIIPTPPVNIPVNTTYENGQNVHNSTIQKELRQSIKNLVNKIKEENDGILPDTKILENVYPLLFNVYLKKELEKRNYKKKDNVIWSLVYWFKGNPNKLKGKYEEAYNLIDKWSANNYTHAGIEYTYTQLLSYVIYTIMKKENEDEQHNILDVLVDETIDSQHVCTTGKFGRLVNVLNGFDNAIEIKLDQTEIINNRMIVIRRKYEATGDTISAKKEAREMLKEFDLSPSEIDNWVNYIEY